LRYRVVDITRVNPDAVMPAFHRTQGLDRVAGAYAGRPVLDAQQVEDVVAFLAALR
jgi:sulfur-oxidizing protein SoxX